MLRIGQNTRWIGMAVLLAALTSSCGRARRVNPADLQGNVAPDRVLYEQALEDIRKGRHAAGRLLLQTLISTYPDSEYLAKAKLGIADSYYKEGGTSGLTQAIAEYRDFRVFFPFLPEAAYAQMQIAMAYYQRMEKPDRDRTNARMAEAELQTFLLEYPEHELAPIAEQRLREVQEVIAEGEYRIARFYFIKGNLRAAAGRLIELVERYPLYSKADEANWMLADAFERAEQIEVASKFYERIVRLYPLSPLAERAKEKLLAWNVPVPQPDPAALARAQQERETPVDRPGFLGRTLLGIFKTGPDVSMAARTGKPTLTPPSEQPGTTLFEPQPGGSTASIVATSPTTGEVAATSQLPTDAKPGQTPSANPSGSSDGESSSKKPGQKPENDKKKKEKEKKKPEEESSSTRRPN
ncbi:MAG: outer membrane protein assembly factor BamD [Acidobacteriia bacterium]|nr:outer membrane protein assembly factor BamD [Terriglobia bacterium]